MKNEDLLPVRLPGRGHGHFAPRAGGAGGAPTADGDALLLLERSAGERFTAGAWPADRPAFARLAGSRPQRQPRQHDRKRDRGLGGGELDPRHARGGQSRIPSGNGCRRRRSRAREADRGDGPNCPPPPLPRPPARFRRIAGDRPQCLRGVHRASRGRAAPPGNATQRRGARTAGGGRPPILRRGCVASQPTERGIRLRAAGAGRRFHLPDGLRRIHLAGRARTGGGSRVGGCKRAPDARMDPCRQGHAWRAALSPALGRQKGDRRPIRRGGRPGAGSPSRNTARFHPPGSHLPLHGFARRSHRLAGDGGFSGSPNRSRLQVRPARHFRMAPRAGGSGRLENRFCTETGEHTMKTSYSLIALAALSAAPALLSAAPPVRLERDAAVTLRLKQALSSETARVNDRVEFEVIEDVSAAGAVVIPKGSTAWGRVADAAPVGRMMRNGRPAVDIESVALADGGSVRLRASGAGRPGARKPQERASGGLGARAALPFAPFQNGKGIEIPAGKLVTVYTAAPVALGSTAEPREVSARSAAPLKPSATSASVLPPVDATPESRREELS